MKKNLYFVPRNTWFYTMFSRFPVYLRYAITLGIMCILFILWVSTSYRIFSKMQSDYLISMHNAQEQNSKLENVYKHIQQLQTSIETKKRDIRHLATSTILPDVYLQELLHSMRQHNLVLQAYTPQPSCIKKWYTKHMIRINCSGSYEDVLVFMQHITDSTLPIVCSYLHLEKQQKGMLVSCHLSWYDFREGKHEKCV